MKKIGLITYHGAYNFGSMLQALSTQKTIKKLKGNCTIINYRLPTQKYIYRLTDWDKKKNPIEFQKEVESLGNLYGYRVTRAKRYEKFMHFFKLTKEFSTFAPCLKEMEKFDILVSGSDQILNMNTGEINSLSIDYMRPYLIDAPVLNKVSYASSFCNMTDEQLSIISPYLHNFNHFSVREPSWADKIQPYCSTKVETVCDPTFLLTKEEWIKTLKLKQRKNNEKYILLYTLYSYEHTKLKLEILTKKLKYFDLKIHVIAPFCNQSLVDIDPRIVECLDFGPKEFLEDLYNAMFVIPESFHGTTFCAIFNKRFVCPCGNKGPELRKIEVLESIGLSNQLRPNFYEITLKDIFEDFDYEEANKLILEKRNNGIEYLKKSIG